MKRFENFGALYVLDIPHVVELSGLQPLRVVAANESLEKRVSLLYGQEAQSHQEHKASINVTP